MTGIGICAKVGRAAGILPAMGSDARIEVGRPDAHFGPGAQPVARAHVPLTVWMATASLELNISESELETLELAILEAKAQAASARATLQAAIDEKADR